MDVQRVAIVTGGNRGLGLETCRQLTLKGYHVVLGARSAEAAETAAQSLADSIPDSKVTPVQIDVTSEADRQSLAGRLESEHGRIDALVNNAGVFLDSARTTGTTSICDVDLDSIRTTFEVNTLAPLALARTLLPLMRKQGYGRIVNVSSGLGQLSDMGGQFPAYRLSKVALNAVTRIFSAEIEDPNIKVNSCCPGWVRTDMGGASASRSVEEGASCAVWLATLPDSGPTGGFFRDNKPIDW